MYHTQTHTGENHILSGKPRCKALRSTRQSKDHEIQSGKVSPKDNTRRDLSIHGIFRSFFLPGADVIFLLVPLPQCLGAPHEVRLLHHGLCTPPFGRAPARCLDSSTRRRHDAELTGREERGRLQAPHAFFGTARRRQHPVDSTTDVAGPLLLATKRTPVNTHNTSRTPLFARGPGWIDRRFLSENCSGGYGEHRVGTKMVE